MWRPPEFFYLHRGRSSVESCGTNTLSSLHKNQAEISNLPLNRFSENTENIKLISPITFTKSFNSELKFL